MYLNESLIKTMVCLDGMFSLSDEFFLHWYVVIKIVQFGDIEYTILWY